MERFSSAVGRVADELGVSTRRLVNHYAPGVLPRSPRRLDTPGADGWRLLESFNALTGVNYTPGTLAAYSDFDLAGFMREFRAVCTLCLASDQEPFDRIGWGCQTVRVCERHRIELLTRCPACGRPHGLWEASATAMWCIRLGGQLRAVPTVRGSVDVMTRVTYELIEQAQFGTPLRRGELTQQVSLLLSQHATTMIEAHTGIPDETLHRFARGAHHSRPRLLSTVLLVAATAGSLRAFRDGDFRLTRPALSYDTLRSHRSDGSRPPTSVPWKERVANAEERLPSVVAELVRAGERPTYRAVEAGLGVRGILRHPRLAELLGQIVRGESGDCTAQGSTGWSPQIEP